MDNHKGLFFRHRSWWHVLFWAGVYIFYALTYGAYNDKYLGEFVANLYIMPLRIAGTYLLIYYVIPSFLFKRKYLAFTIAATIHALLYGVFIAYVVHTYIYCPTCIYTKEYAFGWRLVLESVASNYEIPAVAAAIVFFEKWYMDQQRNQALEKDKLEAELKFLKSQMNPHFLFNTLNNLYALTLKKSEQAPDVVIKLSEILDYMLYHSNDKEVKLSDEIKLIENYLKLEKIRYCDRLTLETKINGNAEGHRIAPLILLPFIENSFKHGASRDTSNPFVSIEISITEQYLTLNVKNSFEIENQSRENYTEGIGLKNVRRRLELLYPNKHVLKIDKESNIFSIYLCINWTDNADVCD